MSKKTNDETIDLLYLNNDNKKSTSKGKNKNKNVPKKSEPQKDIINLDNEIIIGLTPKQTPKLPKNHVTPNKAKKVQTKRNVKSVSKKKKAKQDNNVKNNEKRLKILKWTSIVIIFIGAIVLFMLSPIFNVRQIDIEGIERLTKEEIVNLSQIKIDENTFKVKGVDVIARIEDNPYVETADIKRELPSGIKIVVKERIPQYIIEIANGNAYIDSKGYILEISTEKLQLPVLKGYETSNDSIIDFQNTKKLTDEDCNKLDTINQIYDAAKNNGILEYITSMDMTDIDEIKLNLDNEKKIAYLGNASNANLRILYLKKMIEEESGKEGEAFINGDLNTVKPKPKPYFREKI